MYPANSIPASGARTACPLPPVPASVWAMGSSSGPGWDEDDDKGGKTVTITRTEDEVSVDTPWNVIVYNDPVNLMAYVTMVLRQVFGYSEEKATGMMLDVHQKGLCVVWTGQKERAEFYVRQLQSHQLMAAMKKTSD